MKKNKLLLFLITVVLWGCDKGLEPGEETFEAGFKGRIVFFGDWQPGVTRTHIVLFKEPLLSAADFNAINLKYVSEEIPYGVSQYDFDSRLNSVVSNIQPGEYAYLAVAQSKSILLSLNRASWFVVGVYTGESSTEGGIAIPPNKFLEGINITCDFSNPPDQPPGG